MNLLFKCHFWEEYLQLRGHWDVAGVAERVQVFSKDEAGMLRSWGPRADIPAVNQKAREATAQLLAQLAILRLDSKQVSCLWRKRAQDLSPSELSRLMQDYCYFYHSSLCVQHPL